MTEKDIFEKLFSVIPISNDKNGVVAACLVRDDFIAAEAVSSNDGMHAEYALLQKFKGNIQKGDVIYTTVEPCGSRTVGGSGELMGDCTTNLINAGVKHVVYAASDPHASGGSRIRFEEAGVSLIQVSDRLIVKNAVDMFNATCENPDNWLPLG